MAVFDLVADMSKVYRRALRDMYPHHLTVLDAVDAWWRDYVAGR